MKQHVVHSSCLSQGQSIWIRLLISSDFSLPEVILAHYVSSNRHPWPYRALMILWSLKSNISKCLSQFFFFLISDFFKWWFFFSSLSALLLDTKQQNAWARRKRVQKTIHWFVRGPSLPLTRQISIGIAQVAVCCHRGHVNIASLERQT